MYGSPDDGLRAVRLQAVGNERALDGKISRWEAIETLLDVSAPQAVPATQQPADDVVVAPEPVIGLRVVASEEGSAGTGPA